MGRIRNTLAMAAIGAALAAPTASAAEAPPPAASTPTVAPPQPAGSALAAPVKQGGALVAPTTPSAETVHSSGGLSADGTKSQQETTPPEEAEAPAEETGAASVPSTPAFSIPSIPSSSCAGSGVPPVLIPIYQRAAAAYSLGPEGPSVLAGINEVETAFGTNLNISSAGAEGWMQFMPETWSGYGVDANGDGVKDPFNPEDAIFAAAGYLSANGMPQDTYGAIYAYNHADWYVSEVLANAACYAPAVGGAATAATPVPQLQVLTCAPALAWRSEVPADYLAAFETAAARYDLGRRGVWALAAIARLESNFGKGMGKREMADAGPLGLDPSEWREYAVDGDGDGQIRHADPADSAATLARMIWSKGSLRAGVFSHNQAEWYVQEVLDQAEQMEGRCQVKYVDWAIALPEAANAYVSPFALSSGVVTGRIDQGVDFTGTGPIVAIGKARILSVGAPGWPEGGGVLYQLLDGPLEGQVIFVYEGIDATVQPNQIVQAGEQIAGFRPGGSIEIGFADPAGVPLSHGEYFEGKVTQYGIEMSSLLQSLGISNP
jgi:membrane-bound lytic murein transglycosylase B